MANQFVNPYNFVPLPDRKCKAADKKDNCLTGVIDYVLMTKTPLFIPNSSNDHVFRTKDEINQEQKDKETSKPEENKSGKKKYHKSYDFYSYTDLSSWDPIKVGLPKEQIPVIPGSEVRGLIRSNYELLTDSCLSGLDTRAVLSKRTMESFKAGIIQKNGKKFDLYEADDCIWRTKGANRTEDEDKLWDNNTMKDRQCYIQDAFPEGCEVVFDKKPDRGKGKPIAINVSKSSGQTTGGRKVGYLIKGEDSPESNNQKHSAHIFVQNGETSIVQDINIGILESTLKEYKKNSNSYKEYQKEFENFKNNKDIQCFPVYYSIPIPKQKLLYLSPACKTRETYSTKMSDIAGNLKPCTDINNLCPACSLFGTIIKSDSKSSRIRFSDLEAEAYENYYLQTTTLKALGSPKISNTEFYLKRPDNADFWTFEYYIDRDGKIHQKNAEFSGRKFYWHNLSINDKPNYSIDQKDLLNITVRPLKKGIKFNGKLYFKGISQEELDILVYTLDAGDLESVDNKKHGYKLGGAKPLGFGSVTMQVTGVTLHGYKFDKSTKTVRTEDTQKHLDGFDFKNMETKPGQLHSVENFKTMTNLYAVKPNDGIIDYPRLQSGDNEGYEWFTENHLNRKDLSSNSMINKRKDMVIKEYLIAMNPTVEKNRNHLDDVQVSNGSRGYTSPKNSYKGSNVSQPYTYASRDLDKPIIGIVNRITINPKGKTIGFIYDQKQHKFNYYFNENFCKDIKLFKNGDKVSFIPVGPDTQGRYTAQNVKKLD